MSRPDLLYEELLPKIEVQSSIIVSRQDATAPSVSPATSHQAVPVLSLSTTEAAWICAQADNMDLFLRFGSRGIGLMLADCLHLPSAPTDWLAYRPPNPKYPFDRRWGIGQYVGYFWSALSHWRITHGRPLALPDFSVLSATVEKMLAHDTRWRTFSLIYLVMEHLDLVLYRLGEAGQGVQADESLLTNTLILREVAEITAHGSEWLEVQYVRMATRNTD
jgi:hypothetical protein